MQTLPNTASRPPYANIFILFAFLVGVGVLAGMAAGEFAQSELDRSLRDWQNSLSIVAENGASALGGWVERQQSEIEAIANNESVRLFFLEWGLAEGDLGEIPDFEAQRDYLENLIGVSAVRGGFVAQGRRAANIADTTSQGRALAGLYILDRMGRVIAASSSQPALDLPDLVERPFMRVVRHERHGLMLEMAMPIYASQMPKTIGNEVGYVYALKPVEQSLTDLIKPPRLPNIAISAGLLSIADEQVRYLAIGGRGDDSGWASFSWSLDDQGAAEVRAARVRGNLANLPDWQGREILASARAVSTTPAGLDWVVIASTPRDAALGNIEKTYQRFQIVVWLILGLIAALVVGLWQFGASLKMQRLIQQYQDAADKLRSQKELLRIVTDNQHNSLFILNADNRIVFANARCARMLDSPSDLIGKTLDAVYGPAQAEPYRRLSFDARKIRKMQSDILYTPSEIEGAPDRITVCEHIPLPDDSGLKDCVLVIERDITDEVRERAQKELAQQNLIEALVSVVDMRDPNAANHSRRVGWLSEKLAQEVNLSRSEVETAHTAGVLMNLGKILVPAKTLLSQHKSPDERAIVRAGIRATARMLEGVEFKGPVLDTLEQVQERVDGSGEPLGLRGESILLTARIVAVANAFVSMISPRGYRPALSVEEACTELTKDMGKAFDASVVGALLNFLENKDGRSTVLAQLHDAEDKAKIIPKLTPDAE